MRIKSRQTAGIKGLDFSDLYQQCRNDIYAYLMTFVRDQGTAEDLTALTFERAIKRQNSYQSERGTAKTWLFGIARNAAIDSMRKQLKQTETIRKQQDIFQAGQISEKNLPEQSLEKLRVQELLQTLTTNERELIALKFYSDLANQEIADVLEINVSAVSTRLQRILEKLRRKEDAVLQKEK